MLCNYVKIGIVYLYPLQLQIETYLRLVMSEVRMLITYLILHNNVDVKLFLDLHIIFQIKCYINKIL